MEWYRIVPSPDVLFSDMGEGGILFDLNSKQYYSLNPSAVFVWNYLEAGGELSALEAALAGASAAGSASGLQPFAELLVREQLASHGDAPGVGASPVPDSWQEPRIEPHGNPLAEVILSPFDPTVPMPE